MRHSPYGNRNGQNVPPGGGTCSAPQYTVNAKNQITNPGVGYDADGNLNQGSYPAQYDAENRLINVNNGSVATYVYDANGRRIEKITPSGQIHYFYDEDGHVILEVNQNGAGIKGYAYMAGQHVAEFTTQTYFIHTDHLGSTRTVTNYLGGVTDKMDYLPYGEQIAGDTATTHKFTGYERDAETGLDYAQARYYAYSGGRFMSPDPSGGHLTNPQSLNRYTYVHNNPLILVDPTGLDAELDHDRSCDPGFCDSWLLAGASARLAAWTNGGNTSGWFGGSGSAGNDLLTAAENWSPFGFQYMDDNGAAYPGLFNSWDEYATWSTGVAAKLQWEDYIGGQYNTVTAGLFKNFGPDPKAYLDLNNPHVVGSHANFALECNDAVGCQPGRFKYGIHIECASVNLIVLEVRSWFMVTQ